MEPQMEPNLWRPTGLAPVRAAPCEPPVGVCAPVNIATTPGQLPPIMMAPECWIRAGIGAPPKVGLARARWEGPSFALTTREDKSETDSTGAARGRPACGTACGTRALLAAPKAARR